MTQLYKRMLPVTVLIAGVVILGLAISLNTYSYFNPKQGVITVALNEENNYSIAQPLFFNYHGYVKIRLVDPEPSTTVYVATGTRNLTLDYDGRETTIILGRGGHELYFWSTSPANLKLEVEDYLITPGENILLLLTGIGLTVVGVVSTIYYAEKKTVPLR